MATKNNDFCGFSKAYKLHKACSDDNLRPAMQYVAFQDGYAYATDAYVAVLANLCDISTLPPEDIQKLNGYALHKDQFAELLKFSVLEVHEGKIIAIGAKDARTIFELTKLVENSKDAMHGAFRFPNVESIIADDAKKDKLEAIGFNLKLLNNLAAAMGIANQRIGLRFTNAAGKIFIKGNLDVDVRGIIMPAVID